MKCNNSIQHELFRLEYEERRLESMHVLLEDQLNRLKSEADVIKKMINSTDNDKSLKSYNVRNPKKDRKS
ncbi:hypothetical protein GJ496_002977 [Pomphorhynchus laevis]|nr:hypothetical protein GJ496_002977 [Pomphorhynchus laevis]